MRLIKEIFYKAKGIYETIVIVVGLACIMVGIFFTTHKDNAFSARRTCKIFFWLSRIKLQKIGEFDESATLIIMNHQSVADILCLEAYHPKNICWVAKKELGEIPLYGYALRAPQMILLDREDKRGLAWLLKIAKEKIDEKRPIVIFPEGTRGRGREKFLPFKAGAKMLAERFHLKIQPIVLINTRKVYNTSPLEARSNVARMVLLESFYANEMPSKNIFFGNETTKNTSPKNDSKNSSQNGLNEAQNDLNEVKDNAQDWYKALEQTMQEVYLEHYKELNP